MRPVLLEAPLPYGTPGPVLRGEPKAAAALVFEDVYEEHFDFVWRNVRRLGVDAALVDDAVQEVFITVHRRLAEFEGRSSMRTWLFGIVARVASGSRRSHRRKSPHARPGVPSIDPDAVADESAVGPHEAAARNEGVRVLHELLGELSDEKREVFVLAELERMTAPEIAEATSANVNTVYARLRAARQDFEQAVARHNARDVWRLR